MASIMGEVGSEFHYFNLKESRTKLCCVYVVASVYLLAFSFSSKLLSTYQITITFLQQLPKHCS